MSNLADTSGVAGSRVVPTTRIVGAPAAVSEVGTVTGGDRPHRAREAEVHEEGAEPRCDRLGLFLEARGGIDVADDRPVEAADRPERVERARARRRSRPASTNASATREQRRRVTVLGVGQRVGEDRPARPARVQRLEHRGVEPRPVQRATRTRSCRDRRARGPRPQRVVSRPAAPSPPRGPVERTLVAFSRNRRGSRRVRARSRAPGRARPRRRRRPDRSRRRTRARAHGPGRGTRRRCRDTCRRTGPTNVSARSPSAARSRSRSRAVSTVATCGRTVALDRLHASTTAPNAATSRAALGIARRLRSPRRRAGRCRSRTRPGCCRRRLADRSRRCRTGRATRLATRRRHAWCTTHRARPGPPGFTTSDPIRRSGSRAGSARHREVERRAVGCLRIRAGP